MGLYYVKSALKLFKLSRTFNGYSYEKTFVKKKIYLSDQILHQLVHSKGNIGMNPKHLSQLVLIMTRLQVTIQQIFHHIQKVRVIFIWLYYI